jgi:hypothetical protein
LFFSLCKKLIAAPQLRCEAHAMGVDDPMKNEQRN